MLMAEYDYETDIEVQREEAAETAYDSGLAEGRGIERKMLKQIILLRRSGKTNEEIAEQYNISLEEVKDMLEGIE